MAYPSATIQGRITDRADRGAIFHVPNVFQFMLMRSGRESRR